MVDCAQCIIPLCMRRQVQLRCAPTVVCPPAGTVPAQVLTNDATSIVTTGMTVQPVAPNDPSSSAVVDTGTFLKPDAIDDPGAPSSDSLGAISSSSASAVEVR